MRNASWLALFTACGGSLRHDADSGTSLRDATNDAPFVDAGVLDSGNSVMDAGPCPLSFAVTKLSPPSGYFVDSIAIADVSADKRADLVIVANKQGFAFVFVWTQTPQGTLSGPDSYAAVQTIGMLVFDATGDGNNDVVLASTSGLRIYEQVGGKLAMPVFTTYDSGAIGERGLAKGNFDSNSLVDIVEPSSFGIDIWSQTSAGQYTDIGVASFNMPFYEARPAVADVTGDGVDDLVMADMEKGLVKVYAQTNPMTLGAPTSYAYANLGVGSCGLAVDDVTGDGLADVVVAHGGNNPNAHVTVLAQKSGALAPRVDYPSLDGPGGVAIGDLDCDGRKDIVVTHRGWDLGIYRQNASGTLEKEILIKAQSGQNGGQALAIGDLDGDGRPDIAAVGEGPTDMVVLLSQ